MSLADQQWCPTSVQVTALQARGLRIKGKSGTNDAYAVMQVGKEKYQTSVVEKSVAPVWKEEATFDLPLLHQGSGGGGGGGGAERSTLRVQVLHRALVGPDKLLGQAVINLQQLSEDKTRAKTEWFKLLDKTGKPDKDRGEVLLDIQFMRNNMTASMFDLSAAGKSRSRLGKFKDKVRGKKKESDLASNVVPSFTQVMTDSEEEANGNGEEAAGKDGKSKKHKMKSLFSPKSNLQRNMSQSMSVLPAKNSSLSGSQSSGLNVDSSEGKKKFKFMIHKRSGSSGNKESSLGHQKQVPVEQSNLCINGSHIYCEEPPHRTSRIGSNFSLASSGRGSMEDVPESSPPSMESLRPVRQYSPWMEEEEEEEEQEEKGESIKEDVTESRRKEQEGIRIEEEKRNKEEEEALRKQQEELELFKEKMRQEEEKAKRAEEEKIKKEKEKREEEERVRKDEEQRLAEEKRLEEQRVKFEEEKMRQRVEEERIKREEEEKRAQERQRQEEHRLAEERRLKEEEERRLEEEQRRDGERRQKEAELELMRKQEAEQRRQKEEEERLKEEVRRQKEAERARKEKEEQERLEEKRRQEEEKRVEAEKFRKEEEERLRKEEEIQRKEEEKKRAKIQEEIEEKRRQEEQERRVEQQKREKELEELKRKEEEKKKIEAERLKMEEEERIRKEEEREKRRRIQEEEERAIKEKERLMEEKQRLDEEKVRCEEEERIRKEDERRREEERRQREEEENIRKDEEKRKRKEAEERARKEKEERERLIEETRKLEEQERRRLEEEERIRREEEMRQEEERRNEENERIKREEQERIRREEEEQRARKEKEENERLVEMKRQEEQEKKRMEEEERIRKEEEQTRKNKLGTFPEENKMENKRNEQKTAVKKSKVGSLGEVPSTNPFDENFSEEVPNFSSERLNHKAKVEAVNQRYQSVVPSEGGTGVSSDEKDLVGTQREKRPAPQPPRWTQAERQREKEHDVQTHLIQSKDVKTANVLPQRSVLIAPLNKSPTDAKNTQSLTQNNPTKVATAKHTKRPAPFRPGSVGEQSESKTPDRISYHRGVTEAKQVHTSYGLNPFEEDEDDENELAAHDDSSVSGPVCWPPPKSQTIDKDTSSQGKVKSLKTAHAPPPPPKTDATSSTSVSQDQGSGGHGSNDGYDLQPENITYLDVQDSPKQESQQMRVQTITVAGLKEEGPPKSPRRLQPVKPLNPLDQSASVVQGGNEGKSAGLIMGHQDKAKVNDTGVIGPYSQLTKEELICLVLKQESQLLEKDKKISELEQYIDNLLVRVIEEQPSILMSLSSIKKAT